MLLEVDEHERNVVAAVVILTGLFHYGIGHFSEGMRSLTIPLLSTHLADRLCQSFLLVDQHEAVRRQNEHVVVRFKRVVVHFGLGNDKLLDVTVADGAAHGKFSVDAMHAVLASDPAAVVHDAIALILPCGRLIERYLAHAAVLLEEEGARVAKVSDRQPAVVQQAE